MNLSSRSLKTRKPIITKICTGDYFRDLNPTQFFLPRFDYAFSLPDIICENAQWAVNTKSDSAASFYAAGRDSGEGPQAVGPTAKFLARHRLLRSIKIQNEILHFGPIFSWGKLKFCGSFISVSLLMSSLKIVLNCQVFFSQRELTLTFSICHRPSVCRLTRLSSVCLSVTLVHPILRRVKFSTMFLRHLVRWPPVDIQVNFYGDRPRRTPPSWELNTRGVAKYTGSDFGPIEKIERYISETVQHRSKVSINY